MYKCFDFEKNMADKIYSASRELSGYNSVTFQDSAVCFSHDLDHRITLLHGLAVLLLVLAG